MLDYIRIDLFGDLRVIFIEICFGFWEIGWRMGKEMFYFFLVCVEYIRIKL